MLCGSCPGSRAPKWAATSTVSLSRDVCSQVRRPRWAKWRSCVSRPSDTALSQMFALWPACSKSGERVRAWIFPSRLSEGNARVFRPDLSR